MSDTSFLPQLKRAVVGERISSHHAHRERLSRVTGLAVLSSDPLSSVAYATEEILRVLLLAGTGALALASPIALVIAAILLIVVLSYRQTVHAYPGGGGAYLVAKENLGETPALVAAAALLIDYTLTVAVSIAAGVAALTSAVPALTSHRVGLAFGLIALLTVANLRGLRESGRLFAAPTYFFIVTILAMVGAGLWQRFTGTVAVVPALLPGPPPAEPLTFFLILRAFSNGCTAMTGIEAVSDGVPAFRPPEARNAAATLALMAGLSITMFLGITVLAHGFGVVPHAGETVVSQVARTVFGSGSAWYYAVQAATTLILVLAANTAYADFPRLSSILARDRYLPRQLMNQGDRLAFSNGIVGLSVFAVLLVLVFAADTHALIPLYMVGVFVSFTISQVGMVVRWRRSHETGRKRSAWLNGFGAAVTGLVLVVVAVTKAHEGAWIILLLIPLHVLFFRHTRRHYDLVAAQLSLRGWTPPEPRGHTVIVPVSGVQRAVVAALAYARTLSSDVRAAYVEIDPALTDGVREQWRTWGQGVALTVLPSPYRSLMEPLIDYIDEVHAADPGRYVTIVLPEFVPARWWQHLFHNQRALLIKGALLFRPGTVVTNVPFHLDR